MVDGGCIAIHNITEGLLSGGQEVKVLAVETPKHPVSPQAFPEGYLAQTGFESVFIDTTPRLLDAVISLFKRQPYQVRRFYSKEMAAKIRQVLEQDTYDIVHLESIYVTPYLDVIRRYSKAKIVIRLHNIEHQIWRRLSRNECGPLRKLIYKINANQLEKLEQGILRQVDGYLAISQPDYTFFHDIAPEVPGAVVTFGLDLEKYEDEEDYIPSDEPTLCHIGSMNWSPNLEGIEWFLDEVWPLIHKAHPDLTFTIAGHHIPDHLYNRRDPNVKVVGSVPNANEFMLSHDLVVVPLLSGSGVRIKIVEAMALGKVVITTTTGAEGLDVVDGRHLFIADTPEAFAAVIDKCIATPDICSIIGENARDFISVYHNNSIITETMLDFYNNLLAE